MSRRTRPCKACYESGKYDMDAWTKPTLNRAENPTGFYEARPKACAANAGLKAGGLLKVRNQ